MLLFTSGTQGFFFNPAVVVETKTKKKKTQAAASSTCRSESVVGNCLCGTRGGLNVGQPRAAGPGHEAPPVPAEPRDVPPPASISHALARTPSPSPPFPVSVRASTLSFVPTISLSQPRTRHPAFSIGLLLSLPSTPPRAPRTLSLLRLHKMTDRVFEAESKQIKTQCAWAVFFYNLINK